MLMSTITSKGQTTIPGEVRERLNLHPSDKIIFIPDGDRFYIRMVRGDVTTMAGAFRDAKRGRQNFSKVREAMKAKVAERCLVRGA